ncbi:MAG: YicC/YloC family endoribonuclease [Rhodothermales bacterium]|nr:YicC/YloC family endoribonuclease [Rhodothermales bacterium]
MIASMTGFGRGSAHAHGITATVELRSVNNRFLDVSVRMPRSLAEHEADVQAALKDAFERGRITVAVQLEREADEEALPVAVNAPVARAYGRLLERLREAAGIETPVTLDQVLRYSDVLTTAEEPPEAAAEAWAVVREALADAMEALRTMRRQEGAALHADLTARLDALEATLEDVERRAPLRIEEARARLHERLRAVLDDARIDPDRLELEVALVADKLDVTEECVRLRSHLALFREALGGGEAVGRRLNFLTQEIHREVNTIGSKANDPQVAHLAVGMKEVVEKIREQVQNVE